MDSLFLINSWERNVTNWTRNISLPLLLLLVIFYFPSFHAFFPPLFYLLHHLVFISTYFCASFLSFSSFHPTFFLSPVFFSSASLLFFFFSFFFVSFSSFIPSLPASLLSSHVFPPSSYSSSRGCSRITLVPQEGTTVSANFQVGCFNSRRFLCFPPLPRPHRIVITPKFFYAPVLTGL